MTYYRQPRCCRPRYARYAREPLGGFFDALFAPFETILGGAAQVPTSGSSSDPANAALLAQVCPPSAQTAAWSGRIAQLQATWNPTGTYTPAEMRAVIGPILTMNLSTHNAVTSARESYNIDALAAAEDAFNKIGAQANDYTDAWRAAQAAGTAVSAPGLKQWVIDAMNANTAGMRAIEIAACSKPWWLGALASFQRAFDAAWDAAKAVLGVVLELGEKVLKAAEAPLSLIAWLGKYGGPAALALGALWIITKHRQGR